MVEDNDEIYEKEKPGGKLLDMKLFHLTSTDSVCAVCIVRTAGICITSDCAQVCSLAFMILLSSLCT